MKYNNEYKIAAYVGQHTASVSLKNSKGVLLTATQTELQGNSCAFTCYLGKDFCTVQFKKVGKRWQVSLIAYYGTDRKFMQFLAKTQSQYERFLHTNYDGEKIKLH